MCLCCRQGRKGVDIALFTLIKTVMERCLSIVLNGEVISTLFELAKPGGGSMCITEGGMRFQRTWIG